MANRQVLKGGRARSSINSKRLNKLQFRMIKNTKTDSGINRNDKIIEKLEDSEGIELTSYFGEEDPKRIKSLIKKIKK